jgi:hypothetical protein
LNVRYAALSFQKQITKTWQNGTMAKWHNGKMAKWQNGKMAKWQNGKVTKCQRVLKGISRTELLLQPSKTS